FHRERQYAAQSAQVAVNGCTPKALPQARFFEFADRRRCDFVQSLPTKPRKQLPDAILVKYMRFRFAFNLRCFQKLFGKITDHGNCFFPCNSNTAFCESCPANLPCSLSRNLVREAARLLIP